MMENPYLRNRPWASHEERLTTQALAAAAIPGDMLQEVVAPPLARTQAFPSRYGYDHSPLRIQDIVSVDIRYPGSRVDYSRSVSGYSGSSFPSLGVM